MKKRKITMLLAFNFLFIIITPHLAQSAATVNGTLTLPQEIPGKTYYVIIDTDENGDNGYVRYAQGTCGTGKTVHYSISNVPGGTYYLYGFVNMVGGMEGIDDGDFVGFYGSGMNPPNQANAVVPSSGTVTFDITLGIWGQQDEGWGPQNSGTTKHLSSVQFIDGYTGWVVGDDGTILNTTDGGNTWLTQISGTSEDLQSVHFVNDTKGWAVGWNGTIISTTDGGITWSSQNSRTSYTLNSVYFTDANTGWAVGGSVQVRQTVTYYYIVLKTTNAGETWTSQSSGTSNYLYSVCFVDANTGWTVGIDGNIRKTVNGGITWVSQNSSTSEYLYSVHFKDVNTGWTVGQNGTILKTTNGGILWIPQNLGNSNNNISSVHFIDYNTGWAVGEDGLIFYTEDGGDNWHTQESGTSEYLPSVYFVDANTGWAVGNEGTILKYTGSGTSQAPNITISPDTLFFSVGGSSNSMATLQSGSNFRYAQSDEVIKISPFVQKVQLHTNPMQKSFSDLDTLSNTFEEPYFYLNEEYHTRYEATKLVPKSTCRLELLRFAFYNYENSEKTKECEFFVWEDNQGEPGNEIFSYETMITSSANKSGWLVLDLTAEDINIGAFWIGHHEKTEGAPTSLIDTVGTAGSNFYSSDGIFWYERNYDYLQQAVVSYEASDMESVAQLTVKNTGNANLEISDIYCGKNWVKPVSTKQITLEPGEQKKVEIWCTAENLSDGRYNGTLEIDSNDPDTPVYTIPLVFDVGSASTGNVVSEAEPNNSPEQAQRLLPPSPVTVSGTASVSEAGQVKDAISGDDIEDLFVVTIQEKGIRLGLTEISSDLDLFLLKIEGNSTTWYGSNYRGSAHEEEFVKTDLEPGTYYVGVSIFDPAPSGANSSSYNLTVTGAIITSVEQVNTELPAEFALLQNYPNPFNPSTVIQFSVPKSSRVSLKLYDLLGRYVATLLDDVMQPGEYKLDFEANDLPSGVYFYRMTAAEGFVHTKKLMVLK